MAYNSETAKKAREKAGSRGPNKTSKLVKDVFAEIFHDMQSDPKDNLRAFAKKYPRDFYQLAAKLIPLQMEHAGEVGLIWQEQKIYEAEQKTDEGA